MSLSSFVRSITSSATRLVSNTITGATDIAAQAVKVVSPSIGGKIEQVNNAAAPVIATIGAAGAGATLVGVVTGTAAGATVGGTATGGTVAAGAAAPAVVAGAAPPAVAPALATAGAANLVNKVLSPPANTPPPYIAKPGPENAPPQKDLSAGTSAASMDLSALAKNPLAWLALLAAVVTIARA